MRKCRKVRFSKINAKIALANMQFKDKGAKRIYYHEDCKAWHITSQGKHGTKTSAQSEAPINSRKKESG